MVKGRETLDIKTKLKIISLKMCFKRSDSEWRLPLVLEGTGRCGSEERTHLRGFLTVTTVATFVRRPVVGATLDVVHRRNIHRKRSAGETSLL